MSASAGATPSVCEHCHSSSWATAFTEHAKTAGKTATKPAKLRATAKLSLRRLIIVSPTRYVFLSGKSAKWPLRREVAREPEPLAPYSSWVRTRSRLLLRRARILFPVVLAAEANSPQCNGQLRERPVQPHAAGEKQATPDGAAGHGCAAGGRDRCRSACPGQASQSGGRRDGQRIGCADGVAGVVYGKAGARAQHDRSGRF